MDKSKCEFTYLQDRFGCHVCRSYSHLLDGIVSWKMIRRFNLNINAHSECEKKALIRYVDGRNKKHTDELSTIWDNLMASVRSMIVFDICHHMNSCQSGKLCFSSTHAL